MAMIGDVEVTVTSESVSRRNEVTSRKVEDGSITDNVKNEQDIINISGVVGIDGWTRLKRLQQYKKEGRLLNYRGRNAYNDLVIESFDTDHGYQVKGGFTFTATLVQIQVAKTKLTNIEAAKNLQSQTKKLTNGGTQQPILKSNNIEEKNRLIRRYSI